MYLNIYAIYLKVSVVWAQECMHACLRLILLVGVQGSKLSIYTYPPYHSLIDNRKSQKSCLLNKAKARKECKRTYSIQHLSIMKFKYNKGDGHLYKPFHRYG